MVPKLDRRQSARRSDGLSGSWLSLDELLALEPFQGIKPAKLNLALRVPPGGREPEVKAAVRREIAAGEIICRAGEYGSTAFLLLEGKAVAEIPARPEPRPVRGRDSWSLARMARLFTRRSQLPLRSAPGKSDLGEVSRYGHWIRDRPPPPADILPGDLFGIDACINFYPREATVRAVEACVVVEMLRSLLDLLRESRRGEERIDDPYAAAAVRAELYASPLLSELTAAQLDDLGRETRLLRNDSDEIADETIYAEGDTAAALYLVRSGSIRLSRHTQGGEVIFAYVGRGGAFGLENLMPERAVSRLTLRSLSHRGQFPEVEISGTLTLGRKSTCALRFPQDRLEVGRVHCRLESSDGDVYVVDNDSQNHTLLNGEKIRRAMVAPGDVISILDYHFEIARTPSGDSRAELCRRTATAKALDNVEVVVVPAAAVRRLARESPAFAEAAAAGSRSQPSPPLPGPARSPAHVRQVVELDLYNSQNTLLIDLDRCTRCDECVRACATSHDGVARFTRDGPRVGKYLVTLACRSCTDPKCMIGCPVGSIRRRDSLEIQIEDWCIGCGRCADQCPFGNINMVELAKEDEGPPALRATVCDLCSGYDGPNCVYACPHDAAIRVNPTTFLSPLDR